MNNKGFSLIELLGVIVIVSVLAAVAIPAVTKYIKKTNDRAYDNIYDSSYSAAQAKYMHDLETGNQSYNIGVLYDEGYMDQPIDPANRSFCDGNVDVIELDVDDASDLEVSQYKFEVSLECTGKCRAYYTGKDSHKNGEAC